MANRNFATIQALDRGVKIIEGSFRPNGASAVDASQNQGIGWSVARTSQGLFTVTLQDKYVSLISASADLQLAVAADRKCQLGSIDVTSAKTVEIRVIDSAAAVQDVASDANNRVHFCLMLKNSTVN